MISRTRAPLRAVRTPRQARSRRTRLRILEAARASFEERGFDGTTTAEIASHAGLAVGSVYDYFRDKREILLELLQSTLDEVAETVVHGLAPAIWAEGDPRRHVRDLLGRVFQARSLQPGMQSILWERFFKDDEFRATFEEIEARIRGAIESLLASLRAEGRTRVRDVSTAAFVIHTSIEWTASRLVLGGSQFDDEAVVDTAADMISRFLFEEGDVGSEV